MSEQGLSVQGDLAYGATELAGISVHATPREPLQRGMPEPT